MELLEVGAVAGGHDETLVEIRRQCNRCSDTKEILDDLTAETGTINHQMTDTSNLEMPLSASSEESSDATTDFPGKLAARSGYGADMRSIEDLKHDLPSIHDLPSLPDLPTLQDVAHDVADFVSRHDPRSRRRRRRVDLKLALLIAIGGLAVGLVALVLWRTRHHEEATETPEVDTTDHVTRRQTA
ncbi:hypothetical protein [Desertimonas flava]|uniref:hypothetical protein n=1 Tax=Desertimonas flava TaxID=2064846 RepID=UPI0013C4AFF0|nr:hypothetical protein [Desertimonas flava]